MRFAHVHNANLWPASLGNSVRVYIGGKERISKIGVVFIKYKTVGNKKKIKNISNAMMMYFC